MTASGDQKKKWKHIIRRPWTGLHSDITTRAAEDRTRWKGIDVKSSVVPIDLARLWDRLD